VYISKSILAALGGFGIFVVFISVLLSGTAEGVPEVPAIRAEFYLFAIVLLGVALFHDHTMIVALVGLAAITGLKLLFHDDFDIVEHAHHEWHILLNLFGLLIGFAILAKHFEESNIPQILPRFLPDDWLGGFVLLALVFVMSAFLDNIAAAMIGGTIALTVFKGRVDIGYLAAIVAASNAGGSGSVVGDTTTTMMWIAKVQPSEVFHAYAAAFPAFLVFGVICSIKQHRFQPIQKDEIGHHRVEWKRIAAVLLILVGAIVTNVMYDFPAMGVWIAIIVAGLFCKTPWAEVPHAFKGSVFLLALVGCASMMPVEELPPPSALTAFLLGAISSVFDNIPLTKLAIAQDGYDWGVLAYAVGFGGSMMWFGSSSGVAITNLFPHGKSVGAWIKHGWAIPIGYVVGFLAIYFGMGWNPHMIGQGPSSGHGEHTQVEAPAPADHPPVTED